MRFTSLSHIHPACSQFPSCMLLFCKGCLFYSHYTGLQTMCYISCQTNTQLAPSSLCQGPRPFRVTSKISFCFHLAYISFEACGMTGTEYWILSPSQQLVSQIFLFPWSLLPALLSIQFNSICLVIIQDFHPRSSSRHQHR